MLFARLNPGISIRQEPGGITSAIIDRHAIQLGRFSPGLSLRFADLKIGLQLNLAGSTGTNEEREIAELVRRLSQSGLLEYRLAREQHGEDLVVIEPQVRDYEPRMPEIGEKTALALSRFAYMRRRGASMVLEAPRSGALFRLCDANIAAMIAALSQPQTLEKIRARPGFPGPEFLALLLDCQMLFVLDSENDKGLRSAEGDGDLRLWDFHDLLFHTRSTTGRHANPSGGVRAYANTVDSLPAVRPPWPGDSIDLGAAANPQNLTPFMEVLHRRHSTRHYDDRHPITLAELSRFLDCAARVRPRGQQHRGEDDLSEIETAPRPYPSGGASYELEVYLAVDKCEGLAKGFYHYDAARHALTPIAVKPKQLEALLADGQTYMGAPSMPQVLITIAARFGRVSWKYSTVAYSLILKDVGVLMQTFYLTATDMDLGACAIGAADIDLFAKMTGLPFYVEGTVGQIAIGRAAR